MKSKSFFREVPNRGLRVDDIYNILYTPDEFELTEGNQNQFLLLAHNVKLIIDQYKEL
ncbi:MAG: hypothetical protein KBS43_06210 [Oscillospiraceae bacterium]|nr:hypothetical protein [Candidatus Limimonas coprohippi]